MVDEAERGEVIEQEEREMIHSIFEFGDTILREVMVPRPDMVAAEVSHSLQEVLELILRSGFSRIPVYRGDLDDVVGLAYAKDVLRSLHQGQVSSSGTRRASWTWRVQVLPTMQATSHPASTRAASCGSSSQAIRGRRVMPKQVSTDASRFRERARAKNSASLGFAPGHPPSMKPTPRSSRCRAIVSLSLTDSDSPSRWLPSRSVVS